jgi:hypothetical protein
VPVDIDWNRVALLIPAFACFVFCYVYWRAYRNPSSEKTTRQLADSVERERSWLSPLPARAQLLMICILCGLLGLGMLVIVARGVLWP